MSSERSVFLKTWDTWTEIAVVAIAPATPANGSQWSRPIVPVPNGALTTVFGINDNADVNDEVLEVLAGKKVLANRLVEARALRRCGFACSIREQSAGDVGMLANGEIVHLPSVNLKYARIVDEGFWPRLLKLVGRIPFAEDLAAAWFCVIDPSTPGRVRGVMLAALAWFAIPAAAMPEFLIVIGFTDEIAVGAIVVRMIRKHLKERHYVRARAALGIPEPVAA